MGNCQCTDQQIILSEEELSIKTIDNRPILYSDNNISNNISNDDLLKGTKRVSACISNDLNCQELKSDLLKVQSYYPQQKYQVCQSLYIDPPTDDEYQESATSLKFYLNALISTKDDKAIQKKELDLLNCTFSESKRGKLIKRCQQRISLFPEKQQELDNHLVMDGQLLTLLQNSLKLQSTIENDPSITLESYCNEELSNHQYDFEQECFFRIFKKDQGEFTKKYSYIKQNLGDQFFIDHVCQLKDGRFEVSDCLLSEYMIWMIRQQKVVSLGSFKYMFKTLVELLIRMVDKQFTGNFFTPYNLEIFSTNNDKQKIIKLRDIQSIQCNTIHPNKYYPFFFSPLSDQPINNIKEYFKTQVKSILVTLQFFLLSDQKDWFQFLIVGNMCTDLIKIWTYFCQKNEKDEVLEFILSRILTDTYEIDDLLQLILNIEETSLENDEVISKIKKEKYSQISYNLELNLKIFQFDAEKILCSSTKDFHNSFCLLPILCDFVELNENRVIVLQGAPSSGKNEMIHFLEKKYSSTVEMVYYPKVKRVTDKSKQRIIVIPHLHQVFHSLEKQVILQDIKDNPRTKLIIITRNYYCHNIIKNIFSMDVNFITKTPLYYFMSPLQNSSQIVQQYMKFAHQSYVRDFYSSSEYTQILKKTQKQFDVYTFQAKNIFLIFHKIIQKEMKFVTKYCMFKEFIIMFYCNKLHRNQIGDWILQEYGVLDQAILSKVDNFHEINKNLCNYLFQNQIDTFTVDDYESLNMGKVDLDLCFKCSPYRDVAPGLYQYISHEMIEYYVVLQLYKDIDMINLNQQEDNLIEKSLISQLSFSNELGILQIFKEMIQQEQDPSKLQSLLLIIYETRNNKKLALAGGNAFTLLNVCNFPLCSIDFSRIQIQGAVFNNSCLNHANFDNSVLIACSFISCKFDHSSFSHVNFQNCEFQHFTVFQGHKKKVSCIDYNIDGSLIVSGSYDHDVILWNFKEEPQTLAKLTDSINSISFAPNQKMVACASMNKDIVLIQIPEKKQQLLVGHKLEVNCVKFATHSTILISCSNDKTIIIWNVIDLSVLLTLERQLQQIKTIDLNTQLDIIVSGSCDHSIRLWSTQQKTSIKLIGKHTDIINCVRFNKKADVVLSSSGDHSIRLWLVEDCTQILKIQTGHDFIFSVCFGSDEKSIISGQNDSTVKVFSIGSGKLLQEIRGHHGPVNSICLSPDGTCIASGSTDRTVKVTPLKEYQNFQFKKMKGHKRSITSIKHNTNIFVSTSSDKSIRVWNSKNFQQKLKIKTYGHVYSLSIGPDTTTLVAVLDTGYVVYNLITGELLQTFSDSASTVCFSPCGLFLSVASLDNNNVKIFTVYDRKLMQSLQGHSDTIISMCYSHDGLYIASGGGSMDPSIRLWSTTKYSQICKLEEHSDSVLCLSFSPDDKLLASGSQDSTVLIWNVENHTQVYAFDDYIAPVSSLSFSADGKYIVACGVSNHELIFWGLEDGKQSQIFMMEQCSDVSFSHDGEYVLVGRSSGQIFVLKKKQEYYVHMVISKQYEFSCQNLMFNSCQGLNVQQTNLLNQQVSMRDYISPRKDYSHSSSQFSPHKEKI